MANKLVVYTQSDEAEPHYLPVWANSDTEAIETLNDWADVNGIDIAATFGVLVAPGFRGWDGSKRTWPQVVILAGSEYYTYNNVSVRDAIEAYRKTYAAIVSSIWVAVPAMKE